MRLVIQRVNRAEVSVEDEVVGKIQKGLFVLLGVKDGDTKDDAAKLAEKLSKMRIMADDAEKMNLSVIDTNTSIMVVSQFTLYADTQKGNRPSFIKAGDPKIAEEIYEYFVDLLKKYGITVATGRFGKYMKIDTELDGPVTIVQDTEVK